MTAGEKSAGVTLVRLSSLICVAISGVALAGCSDTSVRFDLACTARGAPRPGRPSQIGYQINLKDELFCSGDCATTGRVRDISDTEFVVDGPGGVTVFDRLNGKARIGQQRYIAGETEERLRRPPPSGGLGGIFADHRDYSFTEYDCIKQPYSGSRDGKPKPETKF